MSYGKAAEFWNARYDKKEFIFGTARNEYLEQQASQYLKAGSKVLSIADGEGRKKPGGIFILQGYTPKQLEYKTGGPSLMENLYTEEIIRDAFAKGFKVLDLCTYEKALKEGTDHSGMSASLGFTAQKC